jgi:hypothetical protein
MDEHFVADKKDFFPGLSFHFDDLNFSERSAFVLLRRGKRDFAMSASAAFWRRARDPLFQIGSRTFSVSGCQFENPDAFERDSRILHLVGTAPTAFHFVGVNGILRCLHPPHFGGKPATHCSKLAHERFL